MTASPEDWLDAIKRIALTDPTRAWLRAHLDAAGLHGGGGSAGRGGEAADRGLPGARRRARGGDGGRRRPPSRCCCWPSR
ncbi:hypothetical protein [Dankookia sp. P2]|uniref:hypothetical protein n=1 Tax=Dankookia sp. P2 TaxID=3423955 RepID=UPI003D676A20